MRRHFILGFGLASYLVFLGTFLYAVGFLGNFAVPRSVDSPVVDPAGKALLVNVGLLAVFALQHSVMARPAFKRWWTRYIPQPMERSTYVLLSSLALILLFWQWRPMGGVIWEVESTVGRTILYALYGAGWLIVLATTFLISHFDLFGLRQVWLHWRGQQYSPLQFTTPGPYKYVRHPLYVGWLTAFWAAPTMSVAHLVFALATTAYILIAIQFEERDLVEFYGQVYRDYRRRVPMLIPGLVGRRAQGGPAAEQPETAPPLP